MSDSVAWCILAGFKITSVFSRIIYHTIESICEFAVNILQGYIYEGKKSVTFNVPKKTKQRNRKSSLKLREDESRNEDPKNKNFYCKTNESLISENMSKESTNIDQNMLISGQRFSFHGTDKIIECNLQDANKVTVSFDFYPFKNQSMLEIKTSSRLNTPDSQKKIVETDKPKMSTDQKQPNVKLNENEIPREVSKLKYKYESEISNEIFNTNNTISTKNDLEIAFSARDLSINEHRTSYEKVQDPLSNEHHLESPVVQVSQDTENLVSKVSHMKDSLGSADKQWSDNYTVGKSEKPDICVNLSRVNKQDITVLSEETRRLTSKQRQINLANNPEHSIINQSPSALEKKQIQQSVFENQQSGFEKDSSTHPKQCETLSTPATSDFPGPGIDKLAFESMSEKNEDSLAETTMDKIKLEQSRMSDTLTNKCKKSVLSSTRDKKPLSEYPSSNDKKFVSESVEDKSVMSPMGDKTLFKFPDGSAKKPTPTAVNKRLTQSLETNRHKPLPRPTTNELSPASPDDKDMSSLPLPVVNKLFSESPASNAKRSEPESNADKIVTSPPADKKLTPETVEEPAPAPETLEEPAPAPEIVEEPGPAPETVEVPTSTQKTVEEPAPAPETMEVPAPTPEIVEEPAPAPEIVEEPAPAPEAAEEPVPEATKEPTPTPEPKESTPSHEDHNEVSKNFINTTNAASKRSLNISTIESNCKAVGEINEGDNPDSFSNKEPEIQAQSIGTVDFLEDISEDINEMLEKGPSIVIAPDFLLNPDIATYGTGICKLDVSNVELSSKYMQDGWDESDKCFYKYVIDREKEMGQYDPTAFEKEFSNEMDRCDKNNSKGENIQRDSSVLFGEVIDKYNPMTEVPKYYDLIKAVDSKYVLEKSQIKCYKKREVIDNLKSVENTNKTNDSKVPSKDTQSRTKKTKKADHSNEASAFGESSGAMQESKKNVKTAKDLGARPKTYPPGARK